MWSLEFSNVSRTLLNCSLEMLCHAFKQPPAVAVLNAWVLLPFQWLKSCSVGGRSGDWLGHGRIFHFFAFKRSWVSFTVCFLLLASSICTLKRCPISVLACSGMQAESIALYISEFLLDSISSDIINKQQWVHSLAALYVHAITLPLPWLTHAVGHQIMSSSFPSLGFSLPIILI